MFSVNRNALGYSAEKLGGCEERLKRDVDRLSGVIRQLSQMELGDDGKIERKLLLYREELSGEARHIRAMSQTLLNIEQTYRREESKIESLFDGGPSRQPFSIANVDLNRILSLLR